jgi:hypothetical protein
MISSLQERLAQEQRERLQCTVELIETKVCLGACSPCRAYGVCL